VAGKGVNDVPDSRFNSDELAAQRLAGGGPHGGGAIMPSMSEQHRLFFAQLPYVFVGAVDADGWPIATLLTGAAGFVQSPDAVSLAIAASPDPADPAAEALTAHRDIGILGIDFATRRRIRANGRIVRSAAGHIEIAVSQSFGNCPQYIQRRVLAAAHPAAGGRANSVESLRHLDHAATERIERADTLFVASHSAPGTGAACGADISHRGGRPGFVRVDGDVLTIPDFRGNRYFNTIGNLLAEPRASLLFVDFDSGDILQLQGTAEVDWDAAGAAQFAGAERLWRLRVTRAWVRKAALPLRWSFLDYSRTTTATGLWH
jgi:predicted pyridoxine 5'-phosphate oxidase superfamily flavin-nucleotide-binding protein